MARIFLQAARALCALLAVALIGWALSEPRFRDAEGLAEGTVWLPIVVALSLGVAGALLLGRFRRFGLWLSLALSGQAVALQMIDAGSRLHYQHYRPFSELLTEHRLLVGFLVLQTLLVGIGVFGRRSVIHGWLRGSRARWRLVVVAVVFVLTSAALSPKVSTYVAELALAAFVQAVNLGCVLLAVGCLPGNEPARIRRWLDGVLDRESEPGPGAGVDRFVLTACLWVTLVATLLALFAYQRHPHIPDEVAYLTQARYYANATISMPVPPVPEAFEIYLMHVRGDVWYPAVAPGWPLALALGVLVGLPWLVNPVLAGVNLLLVHRLLRQLYPGRTARAVVLLLCVSPWYVFMGMNFMNHMFSLFCALLAALCVLRTRNSGRVHWAVCGGVALGVMSLVRPLEALLFAVLLGLWSLGLGGARLRWVHLTALVLSSMMVAALILPLNQALTGDPLLLPVTEYIEQLYHPNVNAIGFGPDRGMGWGLDPYPGHSPRDALINAELNAFSLNIELFGWSTGSLWLLTFFLVAGRRERADYLMVAVLVAVFIAHFFYYFSGGPEFGARYWFLMIVPLAALTARAVFVLEDRDSGSTTSSSLPRAGSLTTAVALLSSIALVNFFPWRAIDKYHHLRSMRPDVRRLARTHDFGRSLVLVRGPHPDFRSAWVYNPLDLQADAPVFAWDKSPEVRARLLEVYADRPVWIIEGPSITGRGFRVSAGPLTAGAVGSLAARSR